MKENRRGRKAKPFEIPALEPLGVTLPNWERELMIAALARTAAKPEPTAREVPDGNAE